MEILDGKGPNFYLMRQSYASGQVLVVDGGVVPRVSATGFGVNPGRAVFASRAAAIGGAKQQLSGFGL
jgi:hypothetical protein